MIVRNTVQMPCPHCQHVQDFEVLLLVTGDMEPPCVTALSLAIGRPFAARSVKSRSASSTLPYTKTALARSESTISQMKQKPLNSSSNYPTWSPLTVLTMPTTKSA